MSRDNRESLLSNDSLAGSSDAAYPLPVSDEHDDHDNSQLGTTGTFTNWWRHPRRKLYVGLAAFVLLVLVAVIIDVAMTKHEPSPDTPVGPLPPPDNPETPWLYPRLPSSVVPRHYALLEEIALAEFQFRGHVNISVNVTRPVDHIVLHALALTINEATLTLDNGTVLTPVAWQYPLYDYLVLNFTERIPVQTAAVLRISFGAMLLTTYPYTGLYGASYQNSTGETVWMAVTQFAARDARRAFPCFDEPALKATFDLTIASQPQWPTVLSNMPALQQSRRPADGWLITTFDRSPVMSTYLLAFTVNDFAYTSAESRCDDRSVTTRVFAPPHLISWTNVSVQVGASIVAHYCDFFKAPYPLPKEDHIAVPQFFFGAMENWGLITYRFDALLLQPNEFTVAQLQRVAQVVAHELAHQWFGNLVTAAWWSDTWLNEGFASFVQYIGLNWAVPELNARDQFLLTTESAAMAFDSNPRAHPVIDLTNLAPYYDTADYQKGASLLRMLQAALGADVWLSGINAYIQAYKYGNARSVDLFAHMTEAATAAGQSFDVSAFMHEWTTVAGFPLVSCATQPAGGNGSTHWQCTQTRYYANPPPANPDTVTRWSILLSFAGTSFAPLYWRKSEPSVSFSVSADTKFIKLNANSSGYYRVMYDEYGWAQLSRALNESAFGGTTPDDRLGVVMDALVFARDERMKWSTLLPLMHFLQFETNWAVWSAAAPSLLNLYSLMADKTDGLSSLYTSYLQQQLQRVAASLNTSRHNTLRDKELYSILGDAIVRFDAGGRRQEFVDRFAALVSAERSVSDVPVDELDLILQAGCWAGGAWWVFEWLYWPAVQHGCFSQLDPRDALSYNQLLRAMSMAANATDTDQLVQFFGAPANGSHFDPPTEHRVTALQYVAQNDHARGRLNAFVGCCLDQLTAALPAPALASVMRTLVASQWEAAELTTLLSRLEGSVEPLVWNATIAGNATATEHLQYSAVVYPDVSSYISSMRWRNG